ncbi:DUF1648 domain-containing protein [Methylorubrum thiocyanatum]|uniref:DUF1648 domain-containing protein n=1 Tax=Methylorubrum thiocyanatum TaxID=47958 RepID=A0AA40VAE7_9HYPH|nr:DUF1648 domain-containing protein [Methylorubrum thiocyanatum]MBA8911342.1 hypothetical protein [Methylorubrum thiocyanatum]GJE82644.1 hypothetical protein CJNNKLLH_4010 [Methylorubrum thiocyanatum]
MVSGLPTFAWFSYLAMMVVVSLLNLYCAAHVRTEKIPMQWNLGGQPTWFAPKLIGLWMIVGILAVTAPAFFMNIKQNAASAGPWYWIGMIAVFCFVAAMYAWHIQAVIAWAEAQR